MPIVGWDYYDHVPEKRRGELASVGRWVDNARKGVELAKLGLAAPDIAKFEVKGALIDPYGHEVVPAEKIRRHYQIHHYGFS